MEETTETVRIIPQEHVTEKIVEQIQNFQYRR